MIKFFKELFDSAKEGVAEAKAELAVEAQKTADALLERQAGARYVLRVTPPDCPRRCNSCLLRRIAPRAP